MPLGLVSSFNFASSGRVASFLANSVQLPVSPNTTCMPPPMDSFLDPPGGRCAVLLLLYEGWYGEMGGFELECCRVLTALGDLPFGRGGGSVGGDPEVEDG